MFCRAQRVTVIFGRNIAEFLTSEPQQYEITTITNAKRS
jgi:hypothetical protein